MDDMISRQAAIETVRKAKSIGQAHRMLVQLPSAQPECEDAVSRFEVLRLIDYSSNDLNDSVDNWYFQGKVKELSSVTPKQPGWIPVTERPPDGEGKTIVTTKWDDGYTVSYAYYWGAVGKWGSITDNVIAWMPLPSPYREGGQDE